MLIFRFETKAFGRLWMWLSNFWPCHSQHIYEVP